MDGVKKQEQNNLNKNEAKKITGEKGKGKKEKGKKKDTDHRLDWGGGRGHLSKWLPVSVAFAFSRHILVSIRSSQL